MPVQVTPTPKWVADLDAVLDPGPRGNPRHSRNCGRRRRTSWWTAKFRTSW